MIASITSICQAIVLHIQYKISPDFPCIKIWWLGSIAQAMGFTCILFLSNPSLYLLAVLANPLILLGHLIHNKGIAVFFDIKTKQGPYIVFFGVFLVAYFYFIVFNNSIVGRGVIVSLFLLLVLFSNAFRLFKNSKGVSSASVRLTAIIYALHGSFSTLYGINILFFSKIQSYDTFNQSFMMVGVFIVPIIANMLIVFGFILMVNQRLNSKNNILMDQLKLEKEIAEDNSLKDSLTGLMNRRYLDNILEKEFNRLKRSNARMSLIMLDIDYFKKYNDYYGHTSGDACLKQIGKILNSIVIRSGDTVARYGGEEFFVVLPETDEKGAMVIAKRIQAIIETLAIPHAYSSVSNSVTTSIGVVTIKPMLLKSPEEAIVLADKAMYLAKQKGRNQIYVSDIQ